MLMHKRDGICEKLTDCTFAQQLGPNVMYLRA